MSNLSTTRLMLVPFTVTLIRAAAGDRARLESLSGFRVTRGWPHADLAEALPFFIGGMLACPELEAWSRLIVRRDSGTIIGDIGFKSLPSAAGEVEIGYGIAEEHRRQGFASEAVAAMVAWAFGQPGVRAVTAECLRDNVGSVGVLRATGFRELGVEGELLKWRIDQAV